MSKVPAGWCSCLIDDLADFKSGGTPSKSNPEFWGGKHPWISGKDLKQHYLSSSIDTLTDKGFSTAKKAPAGSILILVRGMTLLKDFPVGYATKPLSFNQDIKALIPKKNIDGLFLSYLLYAKKHLIKELVSIAGHGTGRLDTESIKAFPVHLPPLPEQTKIAQILSTWDKAIATTEQLIGNSQQQKKALMQSLLTGKKRLPGEDGEWKKVRLGFCIKVIGGNAFKSESFTKSGIPILRISNIKENFTVNLSNCVYYNPIDINQNFKVLNGDIVIAMSGATTGKVGRYYGIKECYLNQRVGKFKVNKNLADPEFIFQLLKLSYVQSEIIIDAIGGAQPNVSSSDIEKIKLSLPPLPEQQKIAAVLTAADNEIDVLQKKLAFLKQEKAALMQQLLTGKRRVKVEAA